MCGIVGILDKTQSEVYEKQIKLMTDAIAHRGPDGDGFHADRYIGLGHRRLSIIDLSDTGSQPMFILGGKLAIVFNGEIFNYKELKVELENKGAVFHSHSDTEVVLWAYHIWGPECFSRFNGMWALAIWDKEEETLLLSRDRFGVKPLHYYEDGFRMLFASESKAILNSGLMSLEVDEDWLYQYVHVGYVDTGEETFFKGIKQFPAAHYEIWKNGKRVKRERYWELDLERIHNTYDYNNPIDQFRELLIDAVRLRLRSDVPVGSCLSGGLDSSTLVCLASEMLKPQSMHTFSSVYNESEYNERPFMEAVVDECKTQAHYVNPSPDEAMAFSILGTYSTERPCAGATMISQLNVMRLAHDHVKVLIDGQGGDELLGGYTHYYFQFLNSLHKQQKDSKRLEDKLGYLDSLFKVITAPEGRMMGLLHLKHSLSSKPLRMANEKMISLLRKNAVMPSYPTLVHNALTERMKDRKLQMPEFSTPFNEEFNNVLYNQFFRQSIPSLLITEDANSMAFSIEARTPFMDYRFVEFAFGLDMHWKIKAPVTKFIQRQATDNILPEKVRNRKDKKGYPTPYSLWLKGPIKNQVEEILFSDTFKNRKIFNEDSLRHYWEGHQNGTADFGGIIYKMLSTELWHRIFIDKSMKIPNMNNRLK